MLNLQEVLAMLPAPTPLNRECLYKGMYEEDPIKMVTPWKKSKDRTLLLVNGKGWVLRVFEGKLASLHREF